MWPLGQGVCPPLAYVILCQAGPEFCSSFRLNLQFCTMCSVQLYALLNCLFRPCHFCSGALLKLSVESWRFLHVGRQHPDLLASGWCGRQSGVVALKRQFGLLVPESVCSQCYEEGSASSSPWQFVAAEQSTASKGKAYWLKTSV